MSQNILWIITVLPFVSHISYGSSISYEVPRVSFQMFLVLSLVIWYEVSANQWITVYANLCEITFQLKKKLNMNFYFIAVVAKFVITTCASLAEFSVCEEMLDLFTTDALYGKERNREMEGIEMKCFMSELNMKWMMQWLNETAA